ncbi:hypothetical protein [Burkholderia gladioli]|uniref:hypothetical protein n=1 Tax=Burkholderia gladioli TaxID=28095 RepID=UPI001C210E1A|nr:hypothetical protein [Burkholderia gladioli]MBU9168187.1 hypothetical protein [Burkholderia gladioli]
MTPDTTAAPTTAELPASSGHPDDAPGGAARPPAGPDENWRLMPVQLEFLDIAPNSNLGIHFTTAGVAWSLGDRAGDSIGFSYNLAVSSASGEPCLSGIEFNDAMLTLRTGDIAGGLARFTLTLFLAVHPEVDYLQGYCTLNEEAVIQASFGAQAPMQWHNGRVSATLSGYGGCYRPICLTVRGALPGNRIDVLVSTKKGLGKVSWSLGPDFSEAGGVLFASQNGQLPLQSLSFGNHALSFVTAAGKDGGGAGTALEFYLNAFITWTPDDLNHVYLRTTSDSSITVLAQVHNRQPQVVSQTDTVFTL